MVKTSFQGTEDGILIIRFGYLMLLFLFFIFHCPVYFVIINVTLELPNEF